MARGYIGVMGEKRKEKEMEDLAIGTRVYNNGDMANDSHHGTITAIKKDRWSNNYQITPDAGSDRTQPYWVPIFAFSTKFEGHSGTRFVTEAAYNEYRNERMAALKNSAQTR